MVFGILLFGLPTACILSLLIYLPICLAHRKDKLPLPRHLTVYAFLVYCCIVLFATVFLWGVNFNPGYYLLNLQPFIWITETYEMGWARMVEQLLLNILMFVPLGFLAPMVFKSLRRLWSTAAFCLCFTIFIETFQYFTGRAADIDDVIMNLLGGILGFLAFALLNCFLRDKPFWRKLLGNAPIKNFEESTENA